METTSPSPDSSPSVGQPKGNQLRGNIGTGPIFPPYTVAGP